MTSYRFINAAKTLVLRDDNQVVQWDVNANQPAQVGDEMKLWHEAGSPAPEASPAVDEGPREAFGLPPLYQIMSTMYGVPKP